MRMTEANKDKARAAIVAAAGVLFREGGLAATGIDAIARRVKQTSGAFYAHFGSKAEVFYGAVVEGFDRLMKGVTSTARADNSRWASRFAAGYLSRTHCDAVGAGCLLPTLTLDVARAKKDVRVLYGRELAAVAAQLAGGCDAATEGSDDRALAILALCAGGVMLARATPDVVQSDKILQACRNAAETIVAGR
jgi:TetR/AcrR family transcriptional repressor of nem operon